MANWLTKVASSLIGKATEGQPRPGPWLLPVTGGLLSAEAGSNWNWWQLGYNVESFMPSALVEACVSAYSQTVAMCPGDHWITTGDGGRERVTTSALCRIMRKPNTYQSISDFLLNSVRWLYLSGNAYALCERNSRYEVSALHLMDSRQCSAMVSETGDIFYQLGGNLITDRLIGDELVVPARDVLHIKLQTNRYDILRGESPLVAVARDIALGDSMVAQQLKFYSNQARPGVTLSTDMVLTKEQVELVRQRWDEQSKGLGAGGTPILTQGLKPVAIPQQNAEEMQLANVMKLSDERIALAFRIPLQILGLGGSGAATEELMRAWIASGLGFCLNHIEEAMGLFFGLKGQPDEYVEFDTRALLRSAFVQRVEGYVRGVQGGIFSPNEARAEFEMPKVEAGNEPRVQQQVVPLSAANAIPAAPPAPSAPATPPTVAAPAEPKSKGVTDADDLDCIRRSFHASHASNLSI
jgi:HK97 family phage portal protein